MDRTAPLNGINVYLSCSPKDHMYLERLRIHLKPMQTNGLIHVWDEANIPLGESYQTAIERMIRSASVAVLLVSADFLASPEIIDHILPLIMEKATLNTMTILPIIVGHSELHYSSLAPYTPINNPARPLKTMEEGEEDREWQKVVQAIRTIQQKDQKENRAVAANQPFSSQPKELNNMSMRHSEEAEPVFDASSIEQLSNALLSAFPTQTSLKLLISYKIMENMEIIAEGTNLEERAHSLVMWAYSQGQMKALITGALARNPGNPKLRKFAMEHGF